MKDKRCPHCHFKEHYVSNEEQERYEFILDWLNAGGCQLNYPGDEKAKQLLEKARSK